MTRRYNNTQNLHDACPLAQIKRETLALKIELSNIEKICLSASIIGFVGIAIGSNTPTKLDSHQSALFKEGVHYTVVDVPEDSKHQLRQPGYDVEGTFEIFSYTCAHCFAFEDVAKSYENATGDKIAKLQLGFLKFPIAETHYYLEKSLSGKNLERAKTEFYEVMSNPEISSPRKSEFMSNFATGQAISAEEIAHLEESAKKFSQATRALAIDLNLSSTPTLYLLGKYQVNMGQVGSLKNLIALSEHLKELEGQPDSNAKPHDKVTIPDGSVGESDDQSASAIKSPDSQS